MSSRRQFLMTSARLLLAVGVWRGCPGPVLFAAEQESAPPPKDDRMIVREADPPNWETPLAGLRSWLTPNELFYVRTHNLIPEIDSKSWRIRIDGAVQRPLTLSFDELRKFEPVSEVVTLECAGNGRAFHRPKVEGTPWEKGAVSTARWTGVRLADVLAQAQLQPEGKHLLLEGADPAAKKPQYVRSIPLQKALEPSTLLVYKMNGAPLPIANGFPVRLLVSGWTGNHSVKWITHLSVIAQPHDGFYMNRYRFPISYAHPGADIQPKDMAMITSLPVKSIITSPEDGMRISKGSVLVTGIAYAGEGKVQAVDVSTDYGSHWEEARLSPDTVRYAWGLWEYSWDVQKPGSYLIMARARDSLGRVQPIEPLWNPEGALWNVIDRIRVSVV
ncbi:MAG: putative Sulfite:cytochrome c oxidoreductase, subunit [Nitrospira sp.]|nr:putative Sulfite:cytochrome c oxidoreductase, subunit [Nitrospira sp.]